MSTNELSCPHCASNAIVGIEVRGAYDGVLYWECSNCGATFQRWSKHDGDFGARLHAKAEPFIHGPTKDKKDA